MTNVSVPMDNDLRKELENLAHEEERDLSSQVRYMCKKFLREGVTHPTLRCQPARRPAKKGPAQ